MGRLGSQRLLETKRNGNGPSGSRQYTRKKFFVMTLSYVLSPVSSSARQVSIISMVT